LTRSDSAAPSAIDAAIVHPRKATTTAFRAQQKAVTNPLQKRTHVTLKTKKQGRCNHATQHMKNTRGKAPRRKIAALH
jgi:hypothetical protein